MQADKVYQRFEQRVADALTSSDPVAAIERAAADPDLSQQLQQSLACADARGIRISALLVVRLRFERLVQGSARAAEWFERDPAAFAEAFRQYHLQVPPTALEPKREAKLFERWFERLDVTPAG
jgi:hypothetical protein